MTVFKVIGGLIAFTIGIWLLPHIREWDFNRRGKKYGAKPINHIDKWFPFGILPYLAVKKAHKENRLLRFFQEQYRDVGSKTQINYILGSFGISTIDPENIKAILATQFKDFSLGSRIGAMTPLLGPGIFTLDGAGWSHSRAMLRPQFGRDQISHLSTIETHITRVIDIAKTHYAKGEQFDIQDIFFRFTLDTATEFLFGESVDSLDEANSRVDAVEFSKAFNLAQEYSALKFRAMKFGFLFNSEDSKRWNKTCHDFVDYYVNKALESGSEEKNPMQEEGRYIFLYALLEQTRDPLVLRNQSLNILLAGRDTTASTLSMGFYLLSIYPDIFQKLRNSILDEFGTDTSKISFETLKRATYLQWFINEVLRLYPVVPNNARMTVKDTVLPRGGGKDGLSPIFIEKGTNVFYNVCVMHRMKEYYGEDAEEFRPERWQGKSRSWEYLPFNGGPRICLGQQFALTELSYAIVRLLQNFKEIISPPSRTNEPGLVMNLTLSAAGGVDIKLIPE